MKNIVIIMYFIFAVINGVFVNYGNNNSNDQLNFSKEYNEFNDFEINKLPNNFFYKLNVNCKYKINNNNILTILQDEKSGIILTYNDIVLDLRPNDERNCSLNETKIYLIKDNKFYYILFDCLGVPYDSHCYELYCLKTERIELVESFSSRVVFVGYNYIVGYTDLGIIGYQRVEFKKVFRNGRFEMDGEYNIVGNYDSYPMYPVWKFYTLVKDLSYEEYDDETLKKTLKAGTKIRVISSDAKTYIVIETEDGRKGKVKVDKVEKGLGRDFIVNGKLFMDYYFLDGTKSNIEVFSPMPAYY